MYVCLYVCVFSQVLQQELAVCTWQHGKWRQRFGASEVQKNVQLQIADRKRARIRITLSESSRTYRCPLVVQCVRMSKGTLRRLYRYSLLMPEVRTRYFDG